MGFGFCFCFWSKRKEGKREPGKIRWRPHSFSRGCCRSLQEKERFVRASRLSERELLCFYFLHIRVPICGFQWTKDSLGSVSLIPPLETISQLGWGIPCKALISPCQHLCCGILVLHYKTLQNLVAYNDNLLFSLMN